MENKIIKETNNQQEVMPSKVNVMDGVTPLDVKEFSKEYEEYLESI